LSGKSKYFGTVNVSEWLADDNKTTAVCDCRNGGFYVSDILNWRHDWLHR
jgi:hypothetical protein